ncbi:MAG TPA: hypothetical protein VK563_04110 [Puia sp.]|nr:hypothetical protein [Puia sp.]
MKGLLLLFVIMGGPFAGPGLRTEAPPFSFIDPTGTYILKGQTEKNKTIGHSGEIRVKLLDKDRVAICFYINKGYPGYESGSFMDTLTYNEDNEVVYAPRADQSCSFLFYFSAYAAETMQVYDNPGAGCGFAPGVMASARFSKYSSEPPIIQDLSARGTAP